MCTISLSYNLVQKYKIGDEAGLFNFNGVSNYLIEKLVT